MAVPDAAHLVFDPPSEHGPTARHHAAAQVRAAVDALAFAEERWDPQAWATVHAAARELVVFLAGVGPPTDLLLQSAAATLDHARSAFEAVPR
ncbi:hypothetical protein OG216_47135 (plasmid) [Streptomycetaceae bacterium NBC_01309]